MTRDDVVQMIMLILIVNFTYSVIGMHLFEVCVSCVRACVRSPRSFTVMARATSTDSCASRSVARARARARARTEGDRSFLHRAVAEPLRTGTTVVTMVSPHLLLLVVRFRGHARRLGRRSPHDNL